MVAGRYLGCNKGFVVTALGDRCEIADHLSPMLAVVVAAPHLAGGRGLRRVRRIPPGPPDTSPRRRSVGGREIRDAPPARFALRRCSSRCGSRRRQRSKYFSGSFMVSTTRRWRAKSSSGSTAGTKPSVRLNRPESPGSFTCSINTAKHFIKPARRVASMSRELSLSRILAWVQRLNLVRGCQTHNRSFLALGSR
ncbi:hypothetical protein NKDENANG_01133 [Candidatus Entotheonellaceae bacterium PAL068K]